MPDEHTWVKIVVLHFRTSINAKLIVVSMIECLFVPCSFSFFWFTFSLFWRISRFGYFSMIAFHSFVFSFLFVGSFHPYQPFYWCVQQLLLLMSFFQKLLLISVHFHCRVVTRQRFCNYLKVGRWRITLVRYRGAIISVGGEALTKTAAEGCEDGEENQEGHSDH